jgi:antitoxin component YwqK of YwqJK toxin-antitoxin module
MNRVLIWLLAVLGTKSILGQNLLDEQGRKTGPWRVEYPDGTTLYEATFREGEPVGLMVRYYENGAVRARMEFDPLEDRSYTELFYKNGKKAAEGLYVGKEKDSVWTYYSDFDGTVRIRENYSMGKLHGKGIRYYYSGGISEEVNWVLNSREGPWLQYYEDGSLRLRGTYRNDMLNGPYEVYQADSTLLLSGAYKDNLSDGTWSYYDKTGKLMYTIEYKEGIPADREKYLQLMQDTLLQHDTIEPPQPYQLF